MKRIVIGTVFIAFFFYECSDNDNAPVPNPGPKEYIEFTFNGRYYRNDWDGDFNGFGSFGVVSGSKICFYDTYLSITQAQYATPTIYPEDIFFTLSLENINANSIIQCNGLGASSGEFMIGDIFYGVQIGVHDQCSGGSGNNVNSYVQFNFTSVPTTVGGYYEASFFGVLEEANLPGATQRNIQGSFRLKRRS